MDDPNKVDKQIAFGLSAYLAVAYLGMYVLQSANFPVVTGVNPEVKNMTFWMAPVLFPFALAIVVVGELFIFLVQHGPF